MLNRRPAIESKLMEKSSEDAAAERLRRNRLGPHGGMSSASGVVQALCGVQAQDLPAARLAIRARTTGLTDTGVEKERVDDRSFVRTWAMRGTLHLVASGDLEWLRRLLSPGIIKANARRSKQLGLDEATYRRALDLIDGALAGGLALNRAGLREVLAAGGVDASGQRAPYLLARAAAEGLICEGRLNGRNPDYVRVEDWLGRQATGGGDRKQDLDRLVHRYLDAYGPAGPEDMAAWSGLGVRECREAFLAAGPGLDTVSIGDRTMWFSGKAFADRAVPSVRLLPAFDTFLLGYRDRSLHIDPKYLKRVNAGGGIVRPVVMVNGRVAGIWRHKRSPDGVQVGVVPFLRLPAAVVPQLEVEAAEVGRFLDVPARLKLEELAVSRPA